MNRFTLTFKSSKFEALYRQKQHKKEFQIFKFNFKILITVAMTREFLKVGLLIVLFILSYAVKHLGKKSYNVLDFSLFTSQIMINGYIIFILYNGTIKNLSTDDFAQYTLGLFHAFLQYGTYLGTRFYLKSLGFLMNTLSIFFYICIEDQKIFISSRYLYFFSVILAFNFSYLNERQKRLYFMVSQQNQQWKQGLNSVLDINLIQCSYNKNSLQLTLEELNKQAKEFFKLNAVYDFKNFTRNIILTKLKQTVLTIEQYLHFLQQANSKKKKVTLELFIYDLMDKGQQKYIDKEENMFNQNYQYLGYFNKKLYKLNIFFYYDQKPVAVVMFQQQEDYQRELFCQSKLQHSQLLQQKILNSNIQLSMAIGIIKNQIDPQKPERMLTLKTLKISLSSLYIQYNKLLNVQCYTLEQNLMRRNQRFQVSKLLADLKVILNPILNQQCKKLENILQDIHQETQITSCYWMLIQILVNLLMNAIQYSYPYTLIQFKLQSKFISNLEKNIIKFSVINDGPKITNKILSQLPVTNPQDLEEYIKCSRQNKLNLGMVVANQLSKIISLHAQIKLKREGTRNYFSFAIVEDSKELMNQNFIMSMERYQLLSSDNIIQ